MSILYRKQQCFFGDCCLYGRGLVVFYGLFIQKKFSPVATPERKHARKPLILHQSSAVSKRKVNSFKRIHRNSHFFISPCQDSVFVLSRFVRGYEWKKQVSEHLFTAFLYLYRQFLRLIKFFCTPLKKAMTI